MTGQWKPDIVIYHDPCMDGFTAAWAVWKRWPDATFIGSNYGKPVPDMPGARPDGKNILIVDFSYKRAELDALANRAASIVILDHHKSAAAELEPFRRFADKPERFTLATVGSMIADLQRGGYPAVCALFDMERSGARLAWDFAHPEKDVPLIVTLIEDRDLWLFKHEQTRDFHLRMSIEEKSFAAWDVARDVMVDVLAAEGAMMGAYRDWLVGKIADHAEIGNVGDHRVPVVDCPYELASEVGDRLCGMFPDRPFAAMRVHDNDGTSFSLRSRGGFDCSTVAVRYGGGGHAGAAGFRVPPSI